MRAAALIVLSTMILSMTLAAVGQSTPRYCNDVYLLDVRGWRLEDLVTAVSLQGLVNRDAPRLYLIHSDSDVRLARYAEELLGCHMREVRSLRWLIEEYRDYIRGVVVYDPGLIDTLNLAITLAGINNAIILHPSNTRLAEDLGLKAVTDLRGRFQDKIHVYREVLRLLPNTSRSSIAILEAGIVNMADYAIKHRMAVVGLSPLPGDAEERNLLEDILEGHPGRLAYGFFPGGGTGEYYGVNLLSRHGKTLIVANYTSSLSFTEHLNQLLEPYQVEEPETLSPEPGRVYATIFISDGDNIAFLQHTLLSGSWWYHPLRGSIPIGWTVNPWIARLAPNLLALLREEATSNDEIVAGVAVAGHMNPTLMPEEALRDLSRMLKPAVEDAGLDTLLSWDPLGYKGFKHFNQVYHYFYPTLFPGDHGYPGVSVWRGTPIIYTVNLYKYEEYRRIVDDILSSIGERPLFIAFLVNVWSFKNLGKVEELAGYLESKGVVLVGPREMAETVKRYYNSIAKPWFKVQQDEVLRVEVDGCRYIRLYSRTSGDLLAMMKVDPFLKTPKGWVWASNLQCTIAQRPGPIYTFTFEGMGVQVIKNYSIDGPTVNVNVSVKGDVKEVIDVALDQLDTITWPPRGLTGPGEVLGPRYAYTPNHSLVERSLGPDPFTICRNCSNIIIYDSAYPYPRALGIAIASPTITEVIDAFNTNKDGVGGDYDNDGHGEFHAIALRASTTNGGLEYSYTIAPLSHGWALRLPPVDPEKLAQILNPILQDILHQTGFNQALSTICPEQETITVTKTMTKTTIHTKIIKTTITTTKTATERETTTREITETKTETRILRETQTRTETITVTKSKQEPMTPLLIIITLILVITLITIIKNKTGNTSIT